MKTAISLPDELFEQAEAVARDLGMSRSRLIRTALEEFLKRRRDAATAESIRTAVDRLGSELSEEDETWLAHNREQLRRVEWDE
jgi:metal-responsive CopG/Arc/MetJ family transcriptional regulator